MKQQKQRLWLWLCLGSALTGGVGQASTLVCRAVNCGHICTEDPITGYGCGSWQCDQDCTLQPDPGPPGSSSGMGGSNGSGSGNGGGGTSGGTGGSGGQSMPPSPPAPDCSVCAPTQSGTGSGVLLAGQPTQCTDTSDAGCQAYCQAISDINSASCNRMAQNTGFACAVMLYRNLGAFCTATVNGGAPYTSGDVSIWDVDRYAPTVCPAADWHIGFPFGLAVGDAVCRADVAVAKTAAERSNCRDDLMNGTGDYFNSQRYSFSISVPGVGGMNAEIGHLPSGQSQSGNQFCESLITRMSGSCAIRDSCERSHCPETSDTTGRYQDGSSCTSSSSGGGSQ